MKIERIETLRADAGWRMFSFLKVTTNDGITGWSEFNESFGSAGLAEVIEKLAPLLIGRDPRRFEQITPKPARPDAPIARRHQPAGDRGDRERAARHQRQGLWRAGLRTVRRPGARAHSGLLVAFRHLSRAQCRADGRAAAAQPTTTSRATLRGEGRGFKALKTNILLIGSARSWRASRPVRPHAGLAGAELGQSRVRRRDATANRASATAIGPEMGLMLDINFHFKTEGFRRIAEAVAPCAADLAGDRSA